MPIKLGINKTNYAPLLCAMAVYLVTYNYYSYLFPPLSSVIFLGYQICKLFFMFLFVWQIGMAVLGKIKRFSGMSYPFLFIMVFVAMNIAMVVYDKGSLSILSRNYNMKLAYDTNDQFGYYFSILNTWMGNMGLALWLSNNVSDGKQINKCLYVSMWLLIIPIILTMITHPELIGVRVSNLEDSTFGGGIWNIGVFGFASIAWLSVAQYPTMNRKYRKIIGFGLVLIVFACFAGLSRTSIFMVVASVGVYFIRSRKTLKTIMNAYFVIILVILLLIVMYAIKLPMFMSILERFTDDTSGTQNVRLLLWEGYISYVDEYFWFGAPEGAAYNYYYKIEHLGEHFLPHSAVINYLIMSGIGGLLSYLSILLIIGFRLKRKSKETSYVSSCMQAWIGGYCILAFMNQTGFAQIIFYMAFGLGIALIRIKENEFAIEGRGK